MPERDGRQPAEVSADFRARLAAKLAPLGFEVKARGAKLSRKRPHAVHHVELSSSQRNQPGNVTCWVALLHHDKATRSSSPGWAAGGGLGVSPFSDGSALPSNIADPEEAEALIALVVERLAFFDLMDDPTAVLRQVSSGCVPGLVHPSIIVPFLRAHLGSDAVKSYARALLAGRQELWPAFLGCAPGAEADSSPELVDHGTQLAVALSADERPGRSEAPSDVTSSAAREAKALRSHFGLQLRAWGEVEAAHRLRRADDAAIARANSERSALADSSVTSVEAARLVLRLATGEDRPPRNEAPRPQFFQYYAGHTSFLEPH